MTKSNYTAVQIYAKTTKNIFFNMKLSLQLFYENNNWYAILSNNEVYLVSQSFLNLLNEVAIIKTSN